MTEKDKDNFDDERSSYYFSKKWLTKMHDMGISDDELKATTKELAQKWGPGHPRFNDLAWAIFNKQVIKLGRTVNSSVGYHDLQMLYFDWALFAYEIGRNPMELLKQANKFALMDYQRLDFIKKVEVSSAKGCESCTNLHGKKYSIDDALKNSVLPNNGCTFKLNKDSKYSWCRCLWVAVV